MAKELVTLENGVKLGVLATFGIAIMTFLSDIKQDIALLKQGSVYEVKSLQYQITELQDCCNGKRSRDKQLVFNNREAILPNGIDENDN